MSHGLPNVGAPDPELRTSPILDDEEDDTLDAELESGACYFYGTPYALGQYVRSGDLVLQCGGRGVWVRGGEIEP